MVILAIVTMGAVALFFSVILSIADTKLRVFVDPKIEAIGAILPQANCGACGFPGCGGYAAALVEKDVDIEQCAPGGAEVSRQIAEILDKKATGQIAKVARVHCRGTEDACLRKAAYSGIPTCRAAALVASGDKLCSWGCLGYGDCERICLFGAINMKADGLPLIDESKCTGCRMCVTECPKNILQMHQADEKAMVFCCSEDNPRQSRMVCKNACIGCGICVRGCPTGAIEMQNNLAVIVAVRKLEESCLTNMEKCPTDAIGLVKLPPEAKQILR